MGERKGKRKLPEAGKVDPVKSRLSGGGGAGRFGRVRVCGTTAAARKEESRRSARRKKQVDEKELSEEKLQREDQREEARCLCTSAYL